MKLYGMLCLAEENLRPYLYDHIYECVYNFRRFLRQLPPAPMGGFQEVPLTLVDEDEETDLEIFQKSAALLKEAMIKC